MTAFALAFFFALLVMAASGLLLWLDARERRAWWRRIQQDPWLRGRE